MGIVWEEYEDLRDGCCYLVVADVEPDSPSAREQLQTGSVLQTLNGTPVSHMSFEELPHWLSQCRPLHLGFSAPLEEASTTAATPAAEARSHRMLSPRRQSRIAQQPASPALGRNAFSARAWAPSENVLSKGRANSNVGLESPAARHACSAVAASMEGLGTSASSCESLAGAVAALESRQPLSHRALQHVPRPPPTRRPP